METTFIKLHMAEDNTPVLFNPKEISFVTYNKETKTSEINFVDGESEAIEVNETVDKIYDILSGKKDKESSSTPKKEKK